MPVSERERTSTAADTYVTDAAEDSALAKDAAPARNPKLADVLVRVAAVAEASGDHATAARLYRRAHTLAPDRSEIALSLGRNLLASHDYAGAAEAFRVALANGGGDEEASRGLGVSLFTLGRYDEALPALHSAASRRSDDRVLRDLAISYDIAGRPEEAQKVYRQALERNPNDPTLRSHLALSYALNGKEGEVSPLLDPIAHSPNLSSHDRRVMAAAYELAGDTHKARQLLRQDYDAADTDKAFSDFDKARTLAPGNRGLAYALIFDPERSSEDARMEIAQLRQGGSQANARPADPVELAEIKGSQSGFRLAEQVADGEPSVSFDMAREQSGEPIQDSPASHDLAHERFGAGVTPVQVADAGPSHDAGSSRARAGRHGAVSGYHVQLGAYRTQPRAEKGWTELQRKAPDELGSVGHIVVADERADGRVPFYQLRTTAYSDRREAADLCQRLKGKSVDCFVLVSRGEKPVPVQPDLVASNSWDNPDVGADAPKQRARRSAASRSTTQVADASGDGRAAVVGAKDAQYQVQLAAYRSLARAEKGWRILNRAAPEVLGGMTHVVVTPEQLPEASPLYRLRTHEFDDRPPADSVCSDLRTRNLDCLVVATRLRTGSNLVAQAPERKQVSRAAKSRGKKGDTVSGAPPRDVMAPDITPGDTASAGTSSPVTPSDDNDRNKNRAPSGSTASIDLPPPEPKPAPASAPEPDTSSSASDASPVADDASVQDQGRHGYGVQLAAFKNNRLAENAWKKMQQKAPDLLGKLQPTIAPPDRTAGGKLYRLRAAVFEERAVADALCYELKARKLDCLVVQTELAGGEFANMDRGDAASPQTSETQDAGAPPGP